MKLPIVAYNIYMIRGHSYVVDQILSGQQRETIVESIHAKLMEVGQKVNNGEIPIELYYITKV